MTWLIFAIGFYVLAAICVGGLLRSRETSSQVTYLVTSLASFFLSAHSLSAFLNAR